MVGTSSAGGIYYLDPRNKDGGSMLEAQEIVAPGTVLSADGLELVIQNDNTTLLYVCQSSLDQIAVFQVAQEMETAPELTFMGQVASEYFDGPATVVIVADQLFTVNARFSLGLPAPGELDPSTFNATFPVVGVDRNDLQAPETPVEAPSATPVEAPAKAPASGSLATQFRVAGTAIGLLTSLFLFG
jgi:hypothetical protein